MTSIEGENKRHILDKEKALEKEPLLPLNILNDARYYAEYRADNAHLTIEILKTTLNYITKIINYEEAIRFIYKEKRITSSKIKDVIADFI